MNPVKLPDVMVNARYTRSEFQTKYSEFFALSVPKEAQSS